MGWRNSNTLTGKEQKNGPQPGILIKLKQTCDIGTRSPLPNPSGARSQTTILTPASRTRTRTGTSRSTHAPASSGARSASCHAVSSTSSTSSTTAPTSTPSSAPRTGKARMMPPGKRIRLAPRSSSVLGSLRRRRSRGRGRCPGTGQGERGRGKGDDLLGGFLPFHCSGLYVLSV